MDEICQAAILQLLRSRVELIHYFLTLLSPCIHPDKRRGAKNARLTQIRGFLDTLYNTTPPCISLSDEVLSITIDKVAAMTNGHLVFKFLNGFEFDYRC